MTAAPRTSHQEVSIKLASALHVHVTTQGLGKVFAAPTDVILSDTTVVQPDIMYVATDRLGRISERGIEGAPTLAIEIVSPSTREIDRITKLRLYAGYGVPWYWIVDPDSRVVEIYGLVEGRYALKTRVDRDEPFAEPFANLTIPLTSLWA